MSTPGHTSGHQSVVVNGTDLLIGDAAYTPVQYGDPVAGAALEGQADDPVAWRASIGRLHALAAERVHFCHSTEIVHS
jgi:glyoxylase-like metal-dependent hydrolase (beta-lactamase superfamily II)